MNTKLRPGIGGYLPLLWYFVFLIPMALLTLYTHSILLRILFVGSGLFVLMIFVRELVTRLRLKIEIVDGLIILPVMPHGTQWPVNHEEEILPLPGFEFQEDVLVKAPYYDGKKRFTVPLEKLTGVWVHNGMSGSPVLGFGTDFFDLHYDVRLFGREDVEAFLAANLPAALLAEKSKFNSIVHRAHKQNLDQLLVPNQRVSAKMKSRRGWIVPVFFGLLFAFFFVSGFTTANPQNLFADSVFWLVWIGICYVIFLRMYGEREVTVNDEWVELRVREKKYRIYWQDVKYFTLQGRLILWGENGRVVIPNEVLQSNKLLLNMLRVKHFKGELEAKPIFMDDFVNSR
jgi:hypothetical protein